MISYSAMAEAVRAGYASASTDTGHVGGRGTFALDHPEKLDRLRLALRTRDDREGQGRHSGVLRQRAPGCPTGTAARPAGDRASRKRRNFRMTTTRIIAGAPANRTAISLWIAAAVLKDPASYIPPGQVSDDPPGRARRLRRARRAQGRPHRRSRPSATSIPRCCSARARTVPPA